MAKDTKMNPFEEIKNALEGETLLIGTKTVIKALQQGAVRKIILAANCAADAVADVRAQAEIAGVEIVQLDVPNDELGVLCKKPFSISILGLRKV